MCGRTCACECKKTSKTCVRCACTRAFLGWSHTTYVQPHILPTFIGKLMDILDFVTKLSYYFFHIFVAYIQRAFYKKKLLIASRFSAGCSIKSGI